MNWELVKLYSLKNREFMVYEEYIYGFDKNNKFNRSWRCKIKGCKGRLYTDYDDKEVIRMVKHSHDKLPLEVAHMMIVNKLRGLI
ncbi:acrosomal process isoform [Tubulinosema ratisbonensis]|uniref:Acrosomal process isoform n=1 Tax=Tubulinosema ratisbonensis TaxID=291195 RepID=A0A437AKY6_9MICR|nr:acrosomal process isoform [Tubulinosema ratisbonensis]